MDCLLTLPCSVGSVDVVETPNSALHAEVLCVMLAQLLCGQFLESVGILGLSHENQFVITLLFPSS